MKEIFFPILRKVSEWPKCVVEKIAFKDAGYCCYKIYFYYIYKKIRSIGREMKEIFFPILRKVSEWPKCVAEKIAFKDAG